MTQRVVVGISGASGAAIGLRILERLAALDTVETHLVISDAAEKTLLHEVGPHALARAWELADVRHDSTAIGSTIASGSFRTAGMIVAPCSMRTLSAIASSLSDNLLVRAADVHLKERRRLVLLTRESPLHLGHLRSMLQATEMGAVVAPPVPAFYLLPQSIAEMVDAIAARAIDLLGIDCEPHVDRWVGLK
ncbi:MAG TPA: UbiX family flavin prenyltransferase [Devosia sp.]|jgi:4-hydroxy-3-polyprenylbenzoate decarboxylase|uniref:UbiX family flavin prenyltransferase n=1 Tax=Devosia sp. TaxID=1871048 RepID=UPI002DDD37CB|nr:UbiX family flavin prenyltransferase [Devosia sp.]HEV2515824.1 UbiX family flavin prenyltransferase [Devosia sp.]